MELDDASDPLAFPPLGVTVEQPDRSLVLRFKEMARAGKICLGLSSLFFVTVVGYGIANNVPTHEYLWASGIFVVLAYFSVAMAVNVTRISVTEKELVVQRGPLPIWFTKRHPVDLLLSLHIKINVGKHSQQSYALVAARADRKKPGRLVGCGGDRELARYFRLVLSRRLGLPEGENLSDTVRYGPDGKVQKL